MSSCAIEKPHVASSVGHKCSLLLFLTALYFKIVFETIKHAQFSPLFKAFDKQTKPTHAVSYETNSGASSASGCRAVSTPEETQRLGIGATFHPLTPQLLINSIRCGWKTSPISLIIFSHYLQIILIQVCSDHMYKRYPVFKS